MNQSLKYKKNTNDSNITKSLINENNNYIPSSVYDTIYLTRKSNTYPKNYVVFDTETTGLDCKNDKIIELAAIKYINNQKVDEFSALINPRRTLDPFIVKLTGIKQSDIETKPTIDKIIPNFFEFIEDYTLVAHNIEFDIDMLACECFRNQISMCQNKLIDTVTLAKKIIPKENMKNYKLETIKKYLKLKNDSHRALDDCMTCAKIYQLYLDKRKK